MDDREILALYRDGRCEEAFTQIVNTYSERLYWHVRTVVGTHADADDLMQDIFVKIWNTLPSFRGESRLFTWIWRIATNEALNHVRHEALRRMPSIDALEAPEDAFPAAEGVDGELAATLLAAAVDSLPPRQRAVFSMRYFDDMSYEDMARVLHLTVGALKASYHIAEGKVRAYVRKHGG